jgi:hypothetical protein
VAHGSVATNCIKEFYFSGLQGKKVKVNLDLPQHLMYMARKHIIWFHLDWVILYCATLIFTNSTELLFL